MHHHTYGLGAPCDDPPADSTCCPPLIFTPPPGPAVPVPTPTPTPTPGPAVPVPGPAAPPAGPAVPQFTPTDSSGGGLAPRDVVCTVVHNIPAGCSPAGCFPGVKREVCCGRWPGQQGPGGCATITTVTPPRTG